MSLDAKEELELVDRVKQGDVEAFEPLVAAWQNKIYHLILRQVNHSEDALDICQTAFLKAFHKIELFRGDSRFGTWLTRIALNECRSRYRQRKNQGSPASLDSVEKESQEPSPSEHSESQEMTQLLHQALADLAPSYSQPLILFHLQGHQQDEISKILGIPVGTVKTRIYRGHKLLAEKMKKHRSDETSPSFQASKEKS